MLHYVCGGHDIWADSEQQAIDCTIMIYNHIPESIELMEDY